MTRIPLSAADEQRRSMEQRLAMSTAEIGLSVRTTNCLEERGIFTVQDLLNSKPEILLGISNFGEKTLEEVYDALEEIETVATDATQDIVARLAGIKVAKPAAKSAVKESLANG